MTIVNRSGINAKFNQIVKKYIDEGYELWPFSGGGCYTNVIGYVDLTWPTDRENMIRVWLRKDNMDVGPKRFDYVDTISIHVKGYGIRGFNDNGTHWPDRGDDLQDPIVYYNVKSVYYDRSSKDRFVYTDNIEEMRAINKLRSDRYDAKREVKSFQKNLTIEKLTPNFIDGIMRRINSMRGFKRATASCIKNVTVDIPNHKDYKMRAYVKYEFNNRSGSIYLG